MGKSYYIGYLIVVSKFIEITLLHECSCRFAAWLNEHLLWGCREADTQGQEFQDTSTGSSDYFASSSGFCLFLHSRGLYFQA